MSSLYLSLENWKKLGFRVKPGAVGVLRKMPDSVTGTFPERSVYRDLSLGIDIPTSNQMAENLNRVDQVQVKMKGLEALTAGKLTNTLYGDNYDYERPLGENDAD